MSIWQTLGWMVNTKRVLRITFRSLSNCDWSQKKIHGQITQDVHTRAKAFTHQIQRDITRMGSSHCLHSMIKWTKRPLIHLHVLEVHPVIKKELDPTPKCLAPTERLHPKLTIQKWKPCKCRKGWILVRMDCVGPCVYVYNRKMNTHRKAKPVQSLAPWQLQKYDSFCFC